MKRFAQKLLLVICALYLSGAHWLVLQSTAWATMVWERTKVTTVSEAVSTTFDGEHPCGMCQAIEKAQHEEERKESEKIVVNKLPDVKLVLMETTTVPSARECGKLSWKAWLRPLGRSLDAPPTPPPLV